MRRGRCFLKCPSTLQPFSGNLEGHLVSCLTNALGCPQGRTFEIKDFCDRLVSIADIQEQSEGRDNEPQAAPLRLSSVESSPGDCCSGAPQTTQMKS